MTTTDPRPATWSEKLTAAFPPEYIAYKPRVWCGECRQARGSKVCGNHKHVNCPRCKQRITEAHVDLSFVGHADVTERLNQVDPRWDWWPMQRNVDKDLLLAAIASGNNDLVDQVIENSPPLIDEHGGFWIKLLIHDDDGNQVVRMGYGDSSNVTPSAAKTGGDLMKELIGDAIRNAAMRFGVALDLWSKTDRAQGEVDRASGDGRLQPAGKQGRRNGDSGGYYPGGAKDEQPGREPEDEAQKLAQLAVDLADRRATEDELRDQCYEPAKKARWLRRMVTDPVTGDQVSLSTVITAAKAAIISHGDDDQQEEDSIRAEPDERAG